MSKKKKKYPQMLVGGPSPSPPDPPGPTPPTDPDKWNNGDFEFWDSTYPLFWYFREPDPEVVGAISKETTIVDMGDNSAKIDHGTAGGLVQLYQDFRPVSVGQRCRVTAHVYYDTSYNGSAPPCVRVPVGGKANPDENASPEWDTETAGLSFFSNAPSTDVDYVTVGTPANLNLAASGVIVVDAEFISFPGAYSGTNYIAHRPGQWGLLVDGDQLEFIVYKSGPGGGPSRFVKFTTPVSPGVPYRVRAIRSSATGNLSLFVYEWNAPQGIWNYLGTNSRGYKTGNLSAGTDACRIGCSAASVADGFHGTINKVGVYGGASVPAGWTTDDGGTILDGLTPAADYLLYYDFDPATLDGLTVANGGSLGAGSNGTLGVGNFAPSYNVFTSVGGEAKVTAPSSDPDTWNTVQLEFYATSPDKRESSALSGVTYEWSPGTTIVLESDATAGNVYWDNIQVELL